jgi:putative transposase
MMGCSGAVRIWRVRLRRWPGSVRGCAGLIGAVERTLGAALRQRCLIHRARNLLANVPKNAQAQVKADYWQITGRSSTCPRISSPARTRAAVRCLLDVRESLTVYLR